MTKHRVRELVEKSPIGPVCKSSRCRSVSSSSICTKADETLGRGQKTDGGKHGTISATHWLWTQMAKAAVILRPRPGNYPLRHLLCTVTVIVCGG